MVAQVALLAGVCVFSLFAMVYLFARAHTQRAQEFLRKRLGADEREKSLLRHDEARKSALAQLLHESGLNWSMNVFVTRMCVAAALGILAGWVFGGAILALAFGVVGLAAFPLIARQARDKRLALCDQQMPQALEIVSLALRAGHPLPLSLSIAAAESPSPIAEELQRAVDENELGRPMADVLLNLGGRLPSSDAVQTFVTAVLVLEQTGGNLIAVIDRIIENARARSHYKQKLRALTAEGRASAKMLSAMPLVFGVLAGMADPTYVSTLFTTSAGNMVLVITLGLWGVGILWTRRLVRTES